MKLLASKSIMPILFTVHSVFSLCAADDSPLILFTAMTGNPDKAEVEDIFSRSQKAGFSQLMLYPRSGLECEYMGEDWLALVGHCLDAGKRRGMKVWLYDEYNWPSGSCKGRVPSENPEWLYAEYAVWKNPDGSFRWDVRRNNSFSMHAKYFDVNAYSESAIRRFMELTHDVYEKRFAPYFADGTIPGIFSDEPAHPSPMKWAEGKPLVRFRWYRELESQYKERTGRDFRMDVEAALRDPSKGEVWEIYTELKGLQFRKAFFDPITAWAKRLGIETCGHLIAEGQPREACNYNGLPLNTLRGFTMPCIDKIRDRLEKEKDEWLTYATGLYAIEHNSTPGGDMLDAHGGIELFALGPCDLTQEQLAQRIWAAALYGIDRYLLSLYHTSARGFREKGGWAMFVSPTQPWFEHCKDLHDTSRKAAKWSRKRFVRNVAVRYPQRMLGRLAVHRAPGEPVPRLTEFVNELAWGQVSFELLQDEESSESRYVLSCKGKGFVEERSGKTFDRPEDVLRWLHSVLTDDWRVVDASGKVVPGLLVRRYADGTAAVLNMTENAFGNLRLEKGPQGTETFALPSCGVKVFDMAETEPWCAKSVIGEVGDGTWKISFANETLKRIWFSSNNIARVKLSEPMKNLRWAVCVDSGRIGTNCVTGTEPFRIKLNGKELAADRNATVVPYGYEQLYRQTEPMDLSAGTHELVLSGCPDNNMFMPALWLSGDFMTDASGAVKPRVSEIQRLAPLSEIGVGDFAGKITYGIDVEVPFGKGVLLGLDTGGLAARVRLGGVDIGERSLPPWEWAIPDDLVGRRLPLEVTLMTSVRPVFGRDDAPDVRHGQLLWTHTQRNADRSGLSAVRWLRKPVEPTGAQDFDVARPDGGKMVQASDFGVSPSSADNVRALNRVLAHCRTNGVRRLVIGKGTYRFSADAPILLNGMTNFVFDGAGADFVFHRRRGSSFHISGCSRLEMRDFSVDWDWEKDPLASVVEVEAVTGGHVDFRFCHYDEFPKRDVRVAYVSRWDEVQRAPGVDGKGPGRGFDMAWNGDRTARTRTEWLSPNLLRVFLGRKKVPFDVGERCRMQHYYYDMGGFVFVRCQDVFLEDVEVKSTPGHAFLVSGGSRYHLRNVNVRTPEGDVRRVISSTADHFHVARSKGWIKLERCEFARGGDDCVNVRDGTAYASGSIGAYTVRTARGNSKKLFSKGDRVELVNADYSPTGFIAPVKEVRVVDAAKQVFDVEFDAPLPSSSGEGYVLLNREYGSCNLILRDCFFHDNRARGVILQSSNATVERCRFLHNESCAMKVTTGWTLKLWCEGYGATNIVVRDCVFERANGANRDSQDIYFGTYRRVSSAECRDACDRAVLRDVLFDGNSFVDSFALTAFIGSCDNIVFRRNVFRNPTPSKVVRAERGAVRIVKSSNVRFEGNMWIPSPYAPNAGRLVLEK